MSNAETVSDQPRSVAGKIRAAFAAIPGRLRRQTSGGAYRPEIDGLRFFAIAIVVFGHYMERAVRFFPNVARKLEGDPLGQFALRPGVGVFLFFAISGFILANQAMKAKHSPLSKPFLKAYFGRRVLRIEPPYMLLLIVTWAGLMLTGYAPEAAHHFDTPPASLTLSLIGSLFYVHDLVWGSFPRLFPPGWSLEVEVQFYILAPLLFWSWFRLGSLWARIALGATLLSGACLASLYTPETIGPVHTEMSLVRHFHYFWLGILLASAQGWIAARMRALPALLAGAVGWMGFVLYVFVPNAPDALLPGLAARLAVYIAIVAMFSSALAPQSAFRAFCARPWVALIGGACYSIYLTHIQILQVLTGLVAHRAPQAGLGAALAIGCMEILVVVIVGLSYYALVERTFMTPDWHRALRAWFSPHDARRAEIGNS